MFIRNPIGLLVVGTLPLLAVCGGGAEAPKPEAAEPAAAMAAPAATTGTASVKGKISFEGEAPPAETIKLSADPKCKEMHHGGGLERQTIKVTDGGLADVLVFVKSGISGDYPAPTEAVLLDQKGCDYHPHMVAMMAKQELKIRNSDPTLHNIHPRPKVNQEFNIGQPREGMESTRTFDKPELMIPVGCDVHPWMRSFISVLSNPFFAVTAEDGSYEIKGLPAGEYEIEALHPRLKPASQKITVKDGEAGTLEMTLTADAG
jgi:hypothetical protein